MTTFQNLITTEEDLRKLLGNPNELVQNKSIPHLDPHAREFIAKSPFLLMATSDRTGMCDVSPRGDAPGFVLVVDEQHLVIPERPGNRRMDSMRNILSNPAVGLIFMIPGLEETLRVNGTACITKDEPLLSRMEAHGRTPLVGIGVQVKECYIHCAKSIKRSNLWKSETWLERGQLPNIAQALADHVRLPGIDANAIAKALQDSYTNRLY
ncbi:pyridoxamine 5'-phosphate oxidase family protein [Paenibacillus chartarius]|uniref:Pyridoxamine 5'-phosphate oxidase family protein n=1 Tax=Paenibacillus chartarius TaxID=747481 RepID=A0ABV6DV33_9BACL